MCKKNQSANDLMTSAGKYREDILRAYCLKQRPVVMAYGILNLDSHRNVTRSLREIFQVSVRPSPRAIPSRPETAFIAIDAKAMPVDAFGPQAEDLCRQLKQLNDEAKQEGNVCGMMVLTMDVESKLSILWPIGFGRELPSTPPGLDIDDWKQPLLLGMNSGVVF